MEKRNKILLTILTILVTILLFILGWVASFILSNKEYYKDEKDISIPTFLYHDIVRVKTGEDYMQTTDYVFKKQMTGLLSLGYEFINYDDLIQYYNGEKKLKNKTAIITFDDGSISNYEVLFPIVKELNIPITINVIDSQIGDSGCLSWEQIKEMYDSGLVSFYTHGKYHDEPYKFKTDEYVQDILSAHQNIEKHLGKSITKVYTYPYGMYEEEKIEALAKEGFVQNLTDNKVNESRSLDLSRLHRQYPLSNSVFMILLKTVYREIRY
jgi:peptidoglycan/xylan/chitin deacetylase (PgdA/CDA1 family)